VPRLVGDVLGIAGRLGHERFLLAGHDWGGIVAWACAMAHPDRIGRLAILNAPHPSVFRRDPDLSGVIGRYERRPLLRIVNDVAHIRVKRDARHSVARRIRACSLRRRQYVGSSDRAHCVQEARIRK
jgi:pimeloyl-ACP methyl ester carboxylesterase